MNKTTYVFTLLACIKIQCFILYLFSSFNNDDNSAYLSLNNTCSISTSVVLSNLNKTKNIQKYNAQCVTLYAAFHTDFSLNISILKPLEYAQFY